MANKIRFLTLFATPFTLLRLCLVTVVSISGCATTPNLPANKEFSQSNWLAHKDTLTHIEKWQFDGRFSAKTDTENWTGSIAWSQNQQEYKINISGPLSTGSIMLEGEEDFALLRLSDTQTATDTDPQSLLYNHTGLKLPVNELKYWLLGLPSPESRYNTVELNKKGQLSKLSQNNWEVTFKRYTTVNNRQIPNKIFLVNHEINVRLIIQKWQIFT